MIMPLLFALQTQAATLTFQGKVLSLSRDATRENYVVTFDSLASYYKVHKGSIFNCLEKSLKNAATVTFSFDSKTLQVTDCR